MGSNLIERAHESLAKAVLEAVESHKQGNSYLRKVVEQGIEELNAGEKPNSITVGAARALQNQTAVIHAINETASWLAKKTGGNVPEIVVNLPQKNMAALKNPDQPKVPMLDIEENLDDIPF